MAWFICYSKLKGRLHKVKVGRETDYIRDECYAHNSLSGHSIRATIETLRYDDETF